MQRTTYDPDSDAVDVREAVDQRDGFFTVSLPVSSDSLSRDGEAFDTDRLRGFARQINSDRTVPVVLSHGRSELSEDRYGALGKIGRVTNADIQTRDGTNLLTADLEIADPDDLAEKGDTGDVEAALRWIRQQFRLGLGAVSVGWQEETDGRDVPGDADLLEISIVGIESDSEAQQAGAEPTKAAVRGFETLSTDDATTRQPSTTGDGPDWYEMTERMAVDHALDILAEYYEDTKPRNRGAPYSLQSRAPVAADVKTLLREFGYTRPSVDTAERLEDLRGDGYETERKREGLLDRLDTVAAHRDDLTTEHDPVSDALATLRRRLTGDDNTTGRSAPAWRA